MTHDHRLQSVEIGEVDVQGNLLLAEINALDQRKCLPFPAPRGLQERGDPGRRDFGFSGESGEVRLVPE